MASIALMGLLTGFAKGAAQRVEKEREENEELIRSRLKLAAVNKQKRDVETAARKKELLDRYNTISPYLDDTINEQEKLALISNETFAKEFAQRKSAGEALDLKSYLQINKDKIPKNFTTVQEYINSLQTTPEAVSPDQMQAALGERRGFLGARTGVSPGGAERIARSLGSGASAAELLAYERAAPSEGEPLADVARFGVIQAEESFKTLESKAQKLRLKRLKEQDPNKQAMLDDEIDVTEQSMRAHKEATTARTAEEKQRSVASITSSTRDYINTRMTRQFGVDWAKFTEAQQVPLGDGRFFEMRGARTDLSPEKQKEILDAVQSYARNALKDNRFLDNDNQPIYDSVREVMVNFGIFGTPARTTPVTGPAARPAAPSTAPAASSTASQIADPNVVIINGVPIRFPSPQAARDAQAEILRRTQGTR